MAESIRKAGEGDAYNIRAVTISPKANLMPFPPSKDNDDGVKAMEGSHCERKRSDTIPLSTVRLSFNGLTVNDSSVCENHEEFTSWTGSFQDNTEYANARIRAPNRPAQHDRRNSYKSGLSHGFNRSSGIDRNAQTWMSEEARTTQEFFVVRNSMKRLFKHADVAKFRLADYIAHHEAMIASKAKTLDQQAENRRTKTLLRVPPITPQQQDMMKRCGLSGNFDQVGNYSRALGEKTIWCEDWQNGKDEIAPWPCLSELKWEGDDRAKTGVGRYPPLPREPGPVSLPWNQLQAIEQYPLDQVARIPTMEDIYLGVDEIDDDAKYDLLNKDLEDAMDEYLES